MLNEVQWRRLASSFPSLASGGRGRALLEQNGIARTVPEGEVLYRDGDACTHLPLVLRGELILTKYGETGRGIALYHVGDGESCILSTLSILNNTAFPAEATSRSKTELLLVPSGAVKELISAEPAWRDFVFSTYHERLAGLIALIEEVVFGKLDVRLAEHLLKRSHRGGDGRGGRGESGGVVETTHQELAVELGSSREVVSRLLKEWERQGVIRLSRGFVAVTQPEKLREVRISV